MAQTNPTSRIIVEGGVSNGQLVGFTQGVDSFSSPLIVQPTQVRWLVNGVTSGGIIQTRPGFKTTFEFDVNEEGQFRTWWLGAGSPMIHPQMGVLFEPSFGTTQFIFAISGSVWCATMNTDGSLGTPRQIYGFAFSPFSDQLAWAKCVQTATIFGGVYTNNQVPRNLLIIQDGVNRAGIWDGMTGITANPVKNITVDSNGDTLYTVGWNETRVGMWMAWSGNRLWVGNGHNVFASDLGDPTHFTEELTLNSGQMYTFPEPVTGMIDRGTSGTTRSEVVIFTRNSTWTLWSGNQARLPSSTAVGWAYTPDFQVKIFSNVGCNAGKSAFVHRGLLYWQSQNGIVLFDSTQTVYSTQNLPPIDQEMTYSKRRIGPNPTGTCAGGRESYVFWSVPVGSVTNGRQYNLHTQVLDRQTTVVHSVSINGPFSYGTTGWQGIWTGIRPVEWATGEVWGQTRSYALSMDLDGVVRIYEAFQGNRADNGAQIPWQIETRTHPVSDTLFDQNTFLYFRVLFDQIIGNLSIRGAWRGLRGLYHDLLSMEVTATPGSVLTPLPGSTGIINSTTFESYTVQQRDIFSPNVRGSNDTCQAAGVESPNVDAIDRAFSLWLQMEGRGAVIAYRIATDKYQTTSEGYGMTPEDGFNITPESQCPERIEGTTPDYILPDAPMQRSFMPVQGKLIESDTYTVPN